MYCFINVCWVNCDILFHFQGAVLRAERCGRPYVFVPSTSQRRQIFTREMEDTMVKMFYGLPKVRLLRLAYDYALSVNAEAIPEKWRERQKASDDWYTGFVRRHPTMKKAEGLAPTPVDSVSQQEINMFLDKYDEILKKNGFFLDKDNNMEENSISTGLMYPNIISLNETSSSKEQKSERLKEGKEASLHNRSPTKDIISPEEQHKFDFQVSEFASYSDQLFANILDQQFPDIGDQPPQTSGNKNLKVGDFVLFEIEVRKKPVNGLSSCCVGWILGELTVNQQYMVTCLHKSNKFGNYDTFYFPVDELTFSIRATQIKCTLKTPVTINPKRTWHSRSIVQFPEPLYGYNLV